jgi:hypothetical protein
VLSVREAVDQRLLEEKGPASAEFKMNDRHR